MKRYYTILALLTIMTLALAASPINPAKVTISLSTRVPEYLVHGFLVGTETENPVIESTTEVEDAFNDGGAQFVYAIKTNVATSFTVTASVTPFSLRYASTPAQVNIDRIYVSDGANNNPAEQVDPASNTYKLLDFTPSRTGLSTYSYTLTVIADQAQVQTAPAGPYESVVSIGITPNN
jgi:hypothetical protein